MTILSGDIKLKKTQVMLDVPEGGGAPTSEQIPDGVSNGLFPDVSEMDRTTGRTKLRKAAVHVDTDNVDSYQGAHIILSMAPTDVNISMVLFTTSDLFDRRSAAVSRLEAYLNTGPQYPGYLFGNHIAGQSTLLLFQKTDALPPIGDTLVLKKREGYSDQAEQYVRIIEASSVLTTFEDDRGSFQRYVVTLKLQSPLLHDFPGFDITRYEVTKSQLATLTKISNTVVADAARYHGISKTEVATAVGDFSIKAASMFTQLVPSSQVETPIADARTNQISAAVVGSGSVKSQTLTAVFNPANSLFVGGAIAPRSLKIVAGATEITDSGGRLMLAGSQVGTVDYENGLLALTVDVFGSGAVTLTITYDIGAVPASVDQSQGFQITAVNRALNYVRTIEPAPAPGTLSVSYMAQGRWYVLRDGGDGALRGAETAYGAGNLNFTTGTVSVTLGALPDVGSSLIYTWVQPTAAREADVLTLDNDGRLYWPFNTSGEMSLDPGSKSIEPGELTITWPHESGTGTRTATDDGSGHLTGDATGSVNYARGVIRVSPNVLPAPGTVVTVTVGSRAKASGTAVIASGSGSFGATDITPGSIDMVLDAQVKGQYLLTGWVNWGGARSIRVTDDGAGNLRAHFGDRTVAVGTVNYSAGTFTLSGSVTLPTAVAAELAAWDNVYLLMDEVETAPWMNFEVV